MLKKISAILAGASLLVAGFGAMPASAAGAPDVPLDDLGMATWFSSVSVTNGQATAPTGAFHIGTSLTYSLSSVFINAHKGQVLSFTSSATDTNGNVVPLWGEADPTVPVSMSPWLSGVVTVTGNGRYYWNSNNGYGYYQQATTGLTNVTGKTFTIPADGGNITSMSISLSTNIYSGNPLDWTRTIPGGRYTVTQKLYANGVEITADTLAGVGVYNTDGLTNAYGLSYTVPSSLAQFSSNSVNIAVCADPAKIAVNDVVKAELYIDGVLKNSTMTGANPINGRFIPLTRTSKVASLAGYRSMMAMDGVDSVTITQFDKDWGVGFLAYYSDYQQGSTWPSGSSHTAAVKLFNVSTNADVSGNCMPQKTGVPTLSLKANGDYEVQVEDGLFANNTLCILYDKAAPSRIVSYTGTWRTDQSNSYGNCTFDKSYFTAGHVYEVDTVSGFYSRYGYAQGATSDGSQPVLNGAGGESAGGGTGSTVQTITFAAPASSKAWVGSANLDLTASSSSTLAISYSSSTTSVCTVDAAGHVTALSAGDCTITASNAGDATYAPNSKTVTFAIAATQPTGSTVQTITFTAPTSATAYVGSEAINLGVTSNSGIAVTYTSSTPSVCTVDPATGHVTALTAGNCTITASTAGNETYAPNSKTVTFAIGAAAAGTTEQTFSLSVPAHPTAGLEGFDLSGTSSSGLAIIYTSPTPDVCTVDKAGHVTTLKAGTCTITASQAGNGTYAPKSQTVTFTIEAQSSAAVTEADDPTKPTALPKTGAWVQSRETYASWNRTKGLLGIKIKVLYIGPVKATATFKVGSKSYSCVVNFGLLKKQASSKLLTLTAPTFCLGKTEKAQLALLKKIKSGTVVTIVINREWRYPTTYLKIRPWKRTMYVKLG